MKKNIDSPFNVINDFQKGKIVIVIDDNGRENEGDLVLSASHCTEKKMAFIIRYTSGIVCTAISSEEARRLNLPPMVKNNDSLHTTAFTITVDARMGITTGISAYDRALTVRNLANSNSTEKDFVRPGHIFPLISHEGGVLVRSGHTEAVVDLCRLSNLPSIGVLCELTNDDGTVMHGSEILNFSKTHKIKAITVSDLIRWRQSQEKLLVCLKKKYIETDFGIAISYVYKVLWESEYHICIIIGDIDSKKEIPVFFHYENIIDDVFSIKNNYIKKILKRMYQLEGCGIFLYLKNNNISYYENHEEAIMRETIWRKFGIGSQILKDIGINSVIYLCTKKIHNIHLKEFGIDVVRTEIIPL